MKTLIALLATLALTGCSMTPEQRMAWGRALQNTGNHMMAQQQINNQRQQQALYNAQAFRRQQVMYYQSGTNTHCFTH